MTEQHSALSDRDQLRLRKYVSSPRGSARRLLRAQLLLLIDEGRSVSEAASLIHVDEDLAHRLIRSFRRLPRAMDRFARGVCSRRHAVAAWTKGDSSRFEGSSRRQVILDLVLTGLLAAIPMFFALRALLAGRTVMGNNDFGWHTEHGLAFQLFPFSPPSPHFLYPLLLRLGYLATEQISLGLVVMVVLLGARALAAGGIYAISRGFFQDGGPRLGRIAAIAAATCALIVESPRVIVHGPRIGAGSAFLPLQTWFNPTALTALPFAIIGVALIVKYVDRAKRGELGWRFQVLTLLVLLCAVLAKPSVTQGVLLMMPLWVLVYARDGVVTVWRVLWTSISRLLIPLFLVSVWQLRFLAEPGRQFAHGGSSTIVWSPLATARTWGLDDPTAWLAVLVPLVGVIVGGVAWLRRPKIVLLVMALVAATAQVMLLAESGARASDGNLGWGSQLVFFLLAIEAIREFFAFSGREVGWRSWRMARHSFAAVILMAALASGAMSIYDGGLRTSPCLRGEIQVTHYDANAPGGSYVATECA